MSMSTSHLFTQKRIMHVPMFPLFFTLSLQFTLILAHDLPSSRMAPSFRITLLHERWDSIVSSYTAHLNASLLFYRDFYGLDDELVGLDSFLLPENFTQKTNSHKDLELLRRKGNNSFLISLARTMKAKRAVKEFCRISPDIPTIQLHLSPWNGLYNDSLSNRVSNNYIQLVPGFVVFDNILVELVHALNISTTAELLVLYDQHFDENVIYDWRKPFIALPMPVRFEPMFSELSVASMHIKQLEVGAKHIFVMASTELTELYLQAAIPQFDARHFRRFIVISKDTMSLKCDDCLSADLFWIRMMPNGRVQTLRVFNEFLKQEEMSTETGYQVPVPTYAETQASFALDVISIAFDFLMKNELNFTKLTHRPKTGPPNSHSMSAQNSVPLTSEMENGTKMEVNSSGKDKQKIQHDGMETIGSNITTLSQLMQRPDQDYEFGHYELHFGDCYYQMMTAMILKVERQVDDPDVDYYKYIGNWTLVDGIVPLYSTLGVDLADLNHFRIVTTIQEPFIQYVSDKRPMSGGSLERPRSCAPDEPVRLNTGQLVEGYCIDLLKMLKQALNFTYELYLVEDGKFGSVDENGNWDGLIGELVLGRAEMAIGPISVLAERENDIDFTVPFYDLVGLSILMKRSEVQTSLFKFLQVLEWPVWTCILGAYLFTSMLLWLFDRFSPYSYTNNRDKYATEAEKREFTLKECLWFCMTSLTPQGGGEAPKNVSGRLVAATWWLFGFIIIASYTANLAAFLTVSRMEQTIGGLDDLAKQYKVEYSPLKGGATETYFRRMAEIEEQFYNIWKQMSLNESLESRDRAKLAVWDYPVSDKNMWRFMQESKLPRTVEEAVDRVLNSEKGFAFIGDAMEIKYATLTNCRLQQVGTEFSRKPYAMAVQTNHVLKEQLSQAILKLQNERKLETCKERWWHRNERAKECQSTEDDSSGISVQNIGGVFLVILAGIGISMLMLLFEYIYYSRTRSPGEECESERRETDNNNQQQDNSRGNNEGGRQSRRISGISLGAISLNGRKPSKHEMLTGRRHQHHHHHRERVDEEGSDVRGNTTVHVQPHTNSAFSVD